MSKIDLFLTRLFNGYYNFYLYLIAMFVLLVLCSCKTSKTVSDIDHKTDSIRVEYRNIVTLKDTTIYVPIPHERIVEVVPMLDTLHLESSTAYCNAWVDTTLMMINGHLVSKETPLKTNISTPINTIYRDSIVYRDRYVDRKVEIPSIPKLYRYLMLLGMLFSLVGGIWVGKKVI